MSILTKWCMNEIRISTNVRRKVNIYIDKRIYFVYTNIKGISIVYTSEEKTNERNSYAKGEQLYNTN